MKVKVKQKHIDRGNRFNHLSCPVALALNDLGFDSASVDESGICLTPLGCRRKISGKVMKFIAAFDDREGGPVKPFEFTMRKD